ncbi:hypothetical protein KC318_g14135 [Hortaea werneckii]|nr:hypothetical protein KC334_g12230 [Hortaea werneckii]KAI7653594.1 hypothetical protein KC318_g14135 [Hortaea werneckii]
MVSVEAIRKANAQGKSLDGLVCVFVGGTGGIGESTARELFVRATRPRAVIVGRSEQKATQLIEDLKEINPEGEAYFLQKNRINHNAGVIADVLRAHPCVKQVNYPKYSETKHHYDTCKLPDGGYGGLLSATFHSMEDAQIFYDHLDTHKGPSLGTNFTLSSPFVILAHYNELDWAAQFGCEASLIRFSVGLEDTDVLKKVFEFALAAILEKNSQI